MAIRVFISFLLLAFVFSGRAQTTQTVSADDEKKFTPYMYWRHGGPEGLAAFKQQHPADYNKQLFYYASSFYVKRNHLTTGVELDESIIDISRFEQYRLPDQAYTLVLPGFKDALVLLPANDLLWTPE